MNTHSSVRLSSYTSLAAVAASGIVAAAHADLLIYEVGTTFTAQLDENPGGDDSAFVFIGHLDLDPLGTSLQFFGLQFRTANPENSNSYIDFAGWTLGFDPSSGRGALALDGLGKGPGSARHFMAGDAVGSFSSTGSTALGGKALSDDVKSGGEQKSKEKGVMDGRTYLGFQVEAVVGLEDPVVNYGWLDLTIGLDQNGALFVTINRWAYESAAGAAAQIPGGNPVPGAGGLFALAMGAAGVRRRRERVA